MMYCLFLASVQQPFCYCRKIYLHHTLKQLSTIEFIRHKLFLRYRKVSLLHCCDVLLAVLSNIVVLCTVWTLMYVLLLPSCIIWCQSKGRDVHQQGK